MEVCIKEKGEGTKTQKRKMREQVKIVLGVLQTRETVVKEKNGGIIEDKRRT